MSQLLDSNIGNGKMVFLGGTCNGSTWRDKIIPMLNIKYFNPVVENWTEDRKDIEVQAREESTFCLYVITPKMTGVYSIAELTDDCNKNPEKTIFVALMEDDGKTFDQGEWKSIQAVVDLVKQNGSVVFNSLEEAAQYINTKSLSLNLLSIGLCDCDCDTPAPQAVNPGSVNKGFTYNEGQGQTETIVMDGPLSQIYSKALNLYFAKKPVDVQVHDSLSAAFESAAIDAAITQTIEVSGELDDQTQQTLSGYKIIPANMDIVESPSAVIYTTSAKRDSIDRDFNIIEQNNDRYTKAGKEFIVFIAPEFGVNGEMTQKDIWLDFDKIRKLNALNIGDKFKRSTEEYFESHGIKAVVGVESLLEWLKTRPKGI